METQRKRDYSQYRNRTSSIPRANSSYRRHGSPPPEPPSRSFKEVFIIQCIACLGIIVVIFILKTTKTPFAENLRVSISSVLIRDISEEELPKNFPAINNLTKGIKNSVQSIFGEVEKETTPVFKENSTKKTQVLTTPIPENVEFRIDEDILKEINSREDFYGDSEKKILGSGNYYKRDDEPKIEKKESNPEAKNFINPLEGIITSSFGERPNPHDKEKPDIHNGIDIAVPENTKTKAVQSGKILSVAEDDISGVYLKYETTEGYIISYAHLNKVLVKEGDNIKQGDIIALSGNTGNSTGPHLHYALKKNDALIDPMGFLDMPYTEEVKDEYLARGENLK